MNTTVAKRLKRSFTEEEKKNILAQINKDIEGGMNKTEAIEKSGIHAPSYYQWVKKYDSANAPVKKEKVAKVKSEETVSKVEMVSSEEPEVEEVNSSSLSSSLFDDDEEDEDDSAAYSDEDDE